MTRFRFRRRRVAAAALLALATMTTISTASAASQGPGGVRAAIAPGSRTVVSGAAVTLRGVFPGAVRAPIFQSPASKSTITRRINKLPEATYQ
jgi:hypothetical protein